MMAKNESRKAKAKKLTAKEAANSFRSNNTLGCLAPTQQWIAARAFLAGVAWARRQGKKK